MTRYALTAAVTVSAYTVIEANSLEEAINMAQHREVVIHFNGSGENPEDSWVIEEADGSPMDITGIEE